MHPHHPKLAAIVRKDPRYAYEAYEFVFQALEYTQTLLGRQEEEENEARHVSGPELVHGICDLALREFGLMARVVFRLWGIERTGDFGEIVFNLIDAQLMSKTDRDTLADFENVFDLDRALVHDYQIVLDEVE